MEQLIFYSQSENGFYNSAIHGTDIPGDAIAITEEMYSDLLAAQSTGKIICADEGGRPIALDAETNSDDMAVAVRAKRDALLRDCDWVTIRALERNIPVPDEWVTYRQALRDISLQPKFPESVEWPVPPALPVP